MCILKDFLLVGDEYPLIWYKIQKESDTIPTWCCLNIQYKKLSETPLKIIGLRQTQNGAEALVQSGKKRMVLNALPLSVYNFSEQKD
ncbi:hypothetical protein [Desulfovibrio litoralis]|uniref:hypothetical protein n=1 Tax=Desulfovibrio litoralis TaxID=466107 RepID=UPI0009340738|nr:hypothetical protein [Desulfovibrio litoralis]